MRLGASCLQRLFESNMAYGYRNNRCQLKPFVVFISRNLFPWRFTLFLYVFSINVEERSVRKINLAAQIIINDSALMERYHCIARVVD